MRKNLFEALAEPGGDVKSMKLKIAVMTFALAMASGAAIAQEEGPGPGGPMHHGMRGEFMGDHGLGLPLHQLNLTDDQKSQIKQIFQAEKPNMKPLMQQQFQSHQQLIQLVTSGNFDQAKATAIAAQESQTHVQLEVEHAKIASQIYQLLSSDQKAKVADLIAKHQQRMQEHMQKQSEPAEQQ
jgi:periplasmic protein CpxP/Spy